MVNVIDAIKAEDKHVYAMVAPATEGQFGPNITMNSWKKAMQAVGFNGFVEVALGADMTAAYEADEWLEAYEAGEKKGYIMLSWIRKYGKKALSRPC